MLYRYIFAETYLCIPINNIQHIPNGTVKSESNLQRVLKIWFREKEGQEAFKKAFVMSGSLLKSLGNNSIHYLNHFWDFPTTFYV